MPKTGIRLFRERNGRVPLLEWLDRQPDKVTVKCMRAIIRLGDMGHELRRPEAECLGNGIYELRVRYGHVNYRILYFFHGDDAVVISHGFAKERRVPPNEIAVALRRREQYQNDPPAHTATLQEGGTVQ